ncbi:MAG: ROK family protein [Erysipelotrichaceae bacterium]|nr:ROK family protein [Erysipelotrichaceae bacterium]
MKTYVGVDLGGTHVRVGKVTADGEMLYVEKRPSYAKEGTEKVINNIIEMIENVPGLEECSGIGIGVPGPCDVANGCMKLSTNLPGFTDFPFAKTISDHFHMPAYIDNDANVAGLAEALVGAGKGLGVVYYTTISTGIGGALVVDGKVVSGKNGYAGEIANIVIDRNIPKFNHLNAGAVENEASCTAIVRKANEVKPELGIAHAGQVFASEDPDIKKIVEGEVENLALLYSIIAHVCNPHAFVFGGGIMKSRDLFMPQLEARFKELVHEGMRDTLFLDAALDEPGVIGAAMLPLSQGH